MVTSPNVTRFWSQPRTRTAWKQTFPVHRRLFFLLQVIFPQPHPLGFSACIPRAGLMFREDCNLDKLKTK